MSVIVLFDKSQNMCNYVFGDNFVFGDVNCEQMLACKRLRKYGIKLQWVIILAAIDLKRQFSPKENGTHKFDKQHISYVEYCLFWQMSDWAITLPV